MRRKLFNTAYYSKIEKLSPWLSGKKKYMNGYYSSVYEDSFPFLRKPRTLVTLLHIASFGIRKSIWSQFNVRRNKIKRESRLALK